jgi:prepilin-type N-terminal cleavage/methylation domain-containing protein
MNKKGFTLVELIVVITILAILWTIAFISFNGFNNDAKNAKVENDLRSIGWALEVVRTTDNLRFIDVVANANTNNEIAQASLVNGWSATISNTWATYIVGNVDFLKLKQNGEWFKDPNSFDWEQDYIYAAIVHQDFSYSEFAGQIVENDVKKAQLKWSYTIIDPLQDATSLISSRANDIPLDDEQEFVWDLYQ